jgi:DNA-binding NtrC family response regulator
MQKRILVADAVRKQCRQFCTLLEKGGYPATPMHSILNLEKRLAGGEYLAVILDIDTVPVDNRTIRELTIKYPGVNFFALSAHRFHPELKDAICYHIYACINKPVDPDELFYWLRCIYQDELDTGIQPEL